MKTKNLIYLILTFICLEATATNAIISPTDFMGVLHSKKPMVIIDASKTSAYKTMHIKGAVNIYHKNLYAEGEVEAMIKSPEELAKIFGSHGVNESSPVVIYDEGSQKYSTRVYWILKYLGVKDVKVLHRDMAQWKKARIPLSRMPVKLHSVSFVPHIKADLYADSDYVKSILNSSTAILVDARTIEEFNGTSEEPLSPGHIPGAVNLNYKDVLSASNSFKTKEQLKEIAKKKGITPEKELILYCKTSIRAAVLFFAFKDILEYPHVKVYDGALAQWIALGNSTQK